MRNAGSLSIAAVTLFLIHLAVGCSSPTEETPTGTIQVRVYGLGNAPLWRAAVHINPGELEEASGTDGVATFWKMPAGEYSVRIEHADYAVWNGTVQVTRNEVTTLTADLSALPGELDVTVLVEDVPTAGIRVSARSAGDDLLLAEGVSGADGCVSLTGIAPQDILIHVDPYDIFVCDPMPVEVSPNDLQHITMEMELGVSVVRGAFEFGNADPHDVVAFEFDLGALTLTPVGSPASFVGSYELHVDVLGYIGATVMGNDSPFEMAAMFTPAYLADSYRYVDAVAMDGRIYEAWPRDFERFPTGGLDADLTIVMEADSNDEVILEVYYWYQDAGEWKYEWIYSMSISLYDPVTNNYRHWGGQVSTESTYGGGGGWIQVDEDGEIFSWLAVAALDTGPLMITPDYFIEVYYTTDFAVVPERGVAAERRIRADLKRRAEDTLIDRVAVDRPGWPPLIRPR